MMFLRNVWKRRAGGYLVALSLGLASAQAQDALTLPGKNYTVAFENSDVAVIRAHYGPHEKIPVHDHTSYSTVFVYLSDSGPVRINHEEEGSKEAPVIRPPTVKGAYRVAPGIAERHSIENLGDLSSDFLRVELRRVSFKMKEPFRGRAPMNLGVDLDAFEFNEAGVKIERIVCVDDVPCALAPNVSPSLLIAFTAVELTSGAPHQVEALKAGAVQWLPASEAPNVRATHAGPAHLLRIVLPAATVQ